MPAKNVLEMNLRYWREIVLTRLVTVLRYRELDDLANQPHRVRIGLATVLGRQSHADTAIKVEPEENRVPTQYLCHLVFDRIKVSAAQIPTLLSEVFTTR